MADTKNKPIQPDEWSAWEVVPHRNFRGDFWTCERRARHWYTQYLSAKGLASGRPSRFRSESAARAAIEVSHG